MPHRSLMIRAIWALCLLGAAANHGLILFRYGLAHDYGGVGAASAWYWTSLTLIDPLVAALLFVRRRVGVIATLMLMATNVAHNLLVTVPIAAGGTALANPLPGALVASQIAFLLFVIVTAPAAWGRRHEKG